MFAMKVVRFLDVLAMVLLTVMAVGASSRADDRAPAARHDGLASHAGGLLVATKNLDDPFFGGSVVYIVRHDADGAFGLIVNRPMAEGSLAEVLAGLGADGIDPAAAERRIPVYFGGPVEKGVGFVLHTLDFKGGHSVPAGHGIGISTRAEVLRALAEGHGPRGVLFALGYAGWGAGQLESEIKRGDWLPTPFDEDLIFSDDAATKWDRAMQGAGLSL